MIAEGFALGAFIQRLCRVCFTKGRSIHYSHLTFKLYVLTSFLLPGSITGLAVVANKNLNGLPLVTALVAAYAGVFLERALFFGVERPIYFPANDRLES